MERADRIRARIASLRDAHAVQKAERITDVEIEWYAFMNAITNAEALARFKAASAARCKQIETVIAQLERELAELTAPKPILQPKPRKK
jgi:hypothetical protein